jgi:hypothetical protein
MSVAEKAGVSFEVIDHNIIPDLYVTLIVDCWIGNRNDPAVAVDRYLGVWRADDLESEQGEAMDPTYKVDWRQIEATPKPLTWTVVEHIQQPDRELLSFKKQSDEILDPESYAGYGSAATHKRQYREFMEAIDRVAADESDDEAWATIDAFRKHQALQHEK